MTREEFKKLAETRVILLDGATGSNLMKAGMPAGCCTEEWILDNPDVILNLKKDYMDAGTQILFSPTFRANRAVIAETGLDMTVQEMNEKLVVLGKEVTKGRALLAGDMTMTGKQLIPNGSTSFDEAFDIAAEQAKALEDAGVDLFVIETMVDLQEMRASVLGTKSVSDLPIMATFSVNEKGYTFLGTDIEAAVLCLERLGVDAVGINCSNGPDKLAQVVENIKKTVKIPVIAKLNAGMPKEINGETVYDMTPAEYKEHAGKLLDLGADIIGGCCGTTPEIIAALHELLEERGLYVPLSEDGKIRERIVGESDKNCISSKKAILKFTDFAGIIRDGVLSESDDLKDCIINGEYEDVSDEIYIEDNEVLLVSVGDVPGLTDEMIENYIAYLGAMNYFVCFEEKETDLLEKDLKYYAGCAAVRIDEMSDKEAAKSIAEKYGAVII